MIGQTSSDESSILGLTSQKLSVYIPSEDAIDTLHLQLCVQLCRKLSSIMSAVSRPRLTKLIEKSLIIVNCNVVIAPKRLVRGQTEDTNFLLCT